MTFMSRIGAAASAVFLLLTVGAPFATAQDASEAPAAEAPAPMRDPKAVVARVGDKEVTEGDIELAREAFAAELSQVAPDQQRSVTIDAYINLELMAQAARDAGLDQTEAFEQRLEFLKLQALRNLFIQENLLGALTDEEVQAGYQSLVVETHEPKPTIRARHILVETKEAAEKIIEELNGGAAFEELAKQSIDPSGQRGGDLGFFPRGQMVKPFEDAAFALQPGETVEEPVETQYGWHVIKVEEQGVTEPPPLMQIEAELRSYLNRQKFEMLIAGLRDEYTVEMIAAPEAEASAGGEEEPAAEEPASTDNAQ